MCYVVEVYYRVQLSCQNELLRGGLVTGEHDFIAGKTAFFRHKQLGIARAVHAATVLFKQFQYGGIGCGFDGEVFFISLVPAKSGIQFVRIVGYSFFVVNMKGSGVFFDDLFSLK